MKNILAVFIITLMVLSVTIPLNSVYGAETNDITDKTSDTIIIIIIVITASIVLITLALVVVVIIIVTKNKTSSE